MKLLTMEKKLDILEHAFAASAGAYYSIDLTRDRVPGIMYQVIDGREYNMNERIGLPENARFSDVIAYWSQYVREEDRPAYSAFFSIPGLLSLYAAGTTHVSHTYWTKSALFEPMLAEQHIVMYEDGETGEVMAITYILDLTQKFREDAYKRELEEKQLRLEAALREAIVSLNWDGEKERTPEEYALFDGQDIHSLIVIPILAAKRLSGYIGFDNPEHSTSELSVRLLASIGAYIGGVKENLFMMEELAEKQASLESSLHELRREKNILDALSIDYTSVYYCDLLKDTMIPVKQGEYTNSMRTEKVLTHDLESYSFRIQYYYDHFVVHESAPDFREKLSAEYLREYLMHNERFAYRFRARPNQAGLQHFEVQIVRLPGDGFKTVMGYRYVDDIVADQEQQKMRLENALAAATLNSEIIDSISKIYWLIYRMDLVSGTYEEISAGSEMHRLTGKSGNTEEVFREVRETFVASEHQEMMREFLDTATLPQRLRETESVAVEYHAASGSWHLGRFIVKKRDAQGHVTNVLYVVRQIDKQKQVEIEYREKLLATAEEARRANIAKTDFLRRMSHDIRTPINGIQGMVAIAEHFPRDLEKQRECRGKVKEAAGFLLALVNNVLDMNKLESGTVVLENKPFDLLETLLESNSIIEMNGSLKGLSISVDHSRILHTHLIGSPLHFKQVLQNIAGNAVKYNREGGAIHLSTEEIACTGDTATYRFTCADTGRGISGEFLQHAFEPFSQEDADARTSYMGTGLGLSIAKQLAEMMGGGIEVKSELNVGSTFSVVLPFAIDKDYEEGRRQEDTAPQADLRGVRVLLTEDNDLNVEIAEFVLENAGMQVVTARNGKEAVDAFRASAVGEFDLILMDVMMPVMDGLSAAKAIRAMDRPDAATVPIFAMTANAFSDDVALSREAGMNEHLSKPLNEEKLLGTISRYLAGGR